MTQEQKTAWDTWPTEMPSCNDEVNCPEYNILNSKEHLRKILKETREKVFTLASKNLDPIEKSAIILAGGKESDFEFYDNDTLHCNFRQEPFFRYIFGLNEPNAIGILDLKKKEAILLITPTSLESQRWLGKVRSFDYYKEEYQVHLVDDTEKIHKILQERHIKYLYLLDGINTDSGSRPKTIVSFPELKNYWLDYKQLYPILTECRVHKTKSEIELLRAACKVTSQAHVYVMRHIKENMKERQLESLFKGYAYYFGGSRHQAYECICGSSNNGSILHYGHAGYPNDRTIKNGDTVVCDMGAEYNGYATDITCSYPVNGKFTKDQHDVHTAVYEAQKAVLKNMKPGVSWIDMHHLAEKTILKNLLKIGIVVIPNNDKNLNNIDNDIELLMKNKIASLFMPHGLGHFLGMTVHDVGGFNHQFKKSQELGTCWLRTTRTLEPGMFITVEPGLYFNESWILQMFEKYPYMKNYVNSEVLKRFIGMGGCRLEDDVLITEDGIENLTICPRSCEEIEQLMKK